MKSTCKHLLLDVDENPEHVLVHLQPLKQSCFTVNDGKKLLVTFQAERDLILKCAMKPQYSTYLHTGHLQVPLSQLSCK